MALDWIQNLFQSEQTRGLSGDSAAAVALDDANPYYNYRLRRHKAEGDIVANPALLWYTSASVKRRGGLGTHVGAEKGEGVATFTDVLLILSQEDYARAMEITTEPWLARATRTLLQEFDEFCRREGFSRRSAQRQLGFRILCDGSPDMGGQTLGLEGGEFVTGLLPNLYTGPVRTSYPVIGIHVNLPGVWDGYKEVGRLYNDEILFTLGSHWLDNFHHPAFREAALYRLQQYPDGSFVHIVNPDLQDRYQVTSTDQGGASVLTLATRDGQPVAYVVLAVIDPPADAAPPPTQAGAGRPGGNPNTIPPPMLIDDELLPAAERRAQAGQGGLGAKTIIPEAPSERIFTLQERGALLQKVHFGSFMEGYDVYLGTRGELGTVVEDKAATFQVRKKRVSLLAHVEGVQVGGYPVAPGVEIPVEGDVVIQVAGQRLEYRDLRDNPVDGWPYVGEIRRPASSSYMVWGEQYRVGRSRDCRVVLPDEPRNDNIQWKPSVGDGAMIRSKSGDIPKSRFYTDSIMVASEHATVDLRNGEPAVICTARHCYVYVRRQGAIIALYPTEQGKSPTDSEMQPGDELLVGNCLFTVGYTPKETAVAPAPAPKVELSTEDLLSAVSAPDLDELDAPSRPDMTPPPAPMPPPRPQRVQSVEDAPPPPPKKKSIDRPAPDEPAAAFGLGETGVAPQAPMVPSVGADSILGPAPEFDEEILPPPTNPKRGSTPPPPPTVERSAPPAREVQLYDEDDGAVDLLNPGPSSPGPLEASPEQTWDADGWDSEDTQDLSEAPPPPPSMRTPPPAPQRFESPPPAPPRAVTPPPPPSRAETPPPPPQRAETPPPPPQRAETPPPPPTRAETPPPPPQRAETPPAPPPRVEAPPPLPVPAPVAAPPAPPAAPVAQEQEPSLAARAGSEPGGFGEVVAVDDAEAQFELGRRMQVVHVGWTINGQVTCGNHSRADLVVPENRVVEDQPFAPADYFVLKVRGRKGSLELRSPRELLIDGDDPAKDVYEEPEKVTIDVIRRDDQGEEDFAVRLVLRQDPSLPDPRARFLEIDCGDPLAAALFTRGLPTKQARPLDLAGLHVTFFFDGEGVVLSKYLETYADGQGGFRPFFVQHGDERFQTAPEDGADVRLLPGDRFVAGNAVYVLRKG